MKFVWIDSETFSRKFNLVKRNYGAYIILEQFQNKNQLLSYELRVIW